MRAYTARFLFEDEDHQHVHLVARNPIVLHDHAVLLHPCALHVPQRLRRSLYPSPIAASKLSFDVALISVMRATLIPPRRSPPILDSPEHG